MLAAEEPTYGVIVKTNGLTANVMREAGPLTGTRVSCWVGFKENEIVILNGSRSLNKIYRRATRRSPSNRFVLRTIPNVGTFNVQVLAKNVVQYRSAPRGFQKTIRRAVVRILGVDYENDDFWTALASFLFDSLK